jgi:hypothetical protein
MLTSPITAAVLYDFVHCPQRVALDAFGDPAERVAISPFVQLLWEKGSAFEKEVVASLKIPFLDLSKLEATERETRTLEAMRNGKPLIYGGRIAADGLLARVDQTTRTRPTMVSTLTQSGPRLTRRRDR